MRQPVSPCQLKRFACSAGSWLVASSSSVVWNRVGGLLLPDFQKSIALSCHPTDAMLSRRHRQAGHFTAHGNGARVRSETVATRQNLAGAATISSCQAARLPEASADVHRTRFGAVIRLRSGEPLQRVPRCERVQFGRSREGKRMWTGDLNQDSE